MRRSPLGLVACSFLLSAAPSPAGVAWYPDRVPAATLIVPFFETGIDVTTTSDDTLLMVANRANASRIIHYTVWDRRGVSVFSGNVTLGSHGQWTASMRDLIAPQSEGTKAALTVNGRAYRGFLSIDVVTTPTNLSPKQAGYPFSMANDLEGFVYYTRLAKGTANGLSMVPLEAFTQDIRFLGFYGSSDRRERITDAARSCASYMISDLTITGPTECPSLFDNKISNLENRLFGSTPLNGRTRLVVFMWNPRVSAKGPSDYCVKNPHHVACETYGTSYPLKVFRESGAQDSVSSAVLTDVIQVFEYSLPFSGRLRLENIPDYGQLPYAFAFNSGFPSAHPELTWDAVFEGNVLP